MKSEIKFPKAYGAYAKNNEIVLSSSSGGVFTLVVEWFIEKYNNNFMVAGAVWDDDFKGVHHILTSDLDEINKMKISKYVQSKKMDVFKEIEVALKKGKYVLFSGCPCEVAGLKLYLGVEYSGLYTIDFICKGSLTPLAMEQYIESIEVKKKSKVTAVNMRYKWPKLDTWIPQFIRIDFANGDNIIKEFYNTEIGHAFRIMQRPSCYKCRFTCGKKISDFTVGDFHGVSKKMLFYNKLGTSALFVNDIKGREIFDGISSMLEYGEADIDYIYNNNKGFKDTQREVFTNILANQGLDFAIKECLSKKEKLKCMLPTKIARIIYSIKRRKLK